MIGSTLGQYEITEKLGEGGMGVVYKALDIRLRRTVALKFLPQHLTGNDTERTRFLREARAAATINHPGVCTIYDIKEEQGRQFIVMEYVEGSTLNAKIPVQKVDEALSYALQIGEALNDAHAKGIVHRDIKADNIMVDAKNRIKVMDFGLAKLKGSLKLTRTSSTVGTLGYMSPEQLRGGEADVRSDIFSFGVLLFEMFTGRLPFKGEHEAALMYSIVNEPPEPLLRLRADLPPDLERIIYRMLEKDPEDRYQHVDDVVSELRRVKKAADGTRSSVTGLRGIDAGPSAPGRPPPSETRIHPGKRRLILFSVAAVCVLAVAGYFLFLAPLRSIDSIAVLPFENRSSGSDAEYLSDGLSESLIFRLSQLPNLKVSPTSSVVRYKGKEIDPIKIGNELNVGAVMSGRVVQRGDRLTISVAYNTNGRYAEAIALCENVLATDSTNQSMLVNLGYALAATGRRREAEDVIRKFRAIASRQYVMSSYVAEIYVALGLKDEAFAEMEKAVSEHDWFLHRLKVDPFMDPLRNDPRFPGLLKKVGL